MRCSGMVTSLLCNSDVGYIACGCHASCLSWAVLFVLRMHTLCCCCSRDNIVRILDPQTMALMRKLDPFGYRQSAADVEESSSKPEKSTAQPPAVRRKSKEAQSKKKALLLGGVAPDVW